MIFSTNQIINIRDNNKDKSKDYISLTLQKQILKKESELQDLRKQLQEYLESE